MKINGDVIKGEGDGINGGTLRLVTDSERCKLSMWLVQVDTKTPQILKRKLFVLLLSYAR